MPGIADRSMVKHTIRSQQRKLREELKTIVKQKATQSAYPSLSRQDKRIAEFHHDRLVQEQSLQKDTKKAERLARRIAQILDQLRKDFNKIKNFLGGYAFTSTVGKDSDCAGSSETDLSAAVDTRQAWKRELENMLTMVWHYVDAQHLGDYALMHVPTSVSDSTCNSSTTATNCCPKVHRPYFHYYTPDGDCLSMAPQAGGASGDSTVVTPAGNYIDKNVQNCVLGWSNTDTPSPAAEGNKPAPATLKHFQITNKDLEIRQLHNLLIGSAAGGVSTDSDAWFSFLFANVNDPNNLANVDEASVKARIEELCLPQAMLDVFEDAATYTDTATFYSKIVSGGTYGTATMATIPSTVSGDANEDDQWIAALAHAPTVCNVEDEPDLQFIFKVVSCVMDNIRSCQINNDREQQVIDYVRDVSECNEAYHQDVFSDMTSIDESELCQRYAVGKELCSDLDQLYKENCCTKQNFFNDVTLDGCCW